MLRKDHYIHVTLVVYGLSHSKQKEKIKHKNWPIDTSIILLSDHSQGCRPHSSALLVGPILCECVAVQQSNYTSFIIFFTAI